MKILRAGISLILFGLLPQTAIASDDTETGYDRCFDEVWRTSFLKEDGRVFFITENARIVLDFKNQADCVLYSYRAKQVAPVDRPICYVKLNWRPCRPGEEEGVQPN